MILQETQACCASRISCKIAKLASRDCSDGALSASTESLACV